jgi:hypothetical protein
LDLRSDSREEIDAKPKFKSNALTPITPRGKNSTFSFKNVLDEINNKNIEPTAKRMDQNNNMGRQFKKPFETNKTNKDR